MNSIGTLFVKALIDAGAPRLLTDLKHEHFTDEERPTYVAVKGHWERYGVLPSLDALRLQGFNLPPRAQEPPIYYVDRIRERFALNHVNSCLIDFKEAMKGRRVSEVEEILRRMLTGITGTLSPHRHSTLQAVMADVVADYNYAVDNPGLRGIPFGWPTLNDMTLGAQPGDLVVIAGRPGMGKSYQLIECAHAAWVHNYSALFVSMEMPLLQIGRRWVGRVTRINPRLIHKGQLSMFGEDRFRTTVQDISQSSAPVHLISGDVEKRVDGIASSARELSPDIIFIDAAYLLEPSLRQKGGASKWEDLTAVIHELRALALALNRPIVITVQFNRNQKKNSKGDPDLADLGGTDAIGQDATIVIGVRQGQAPFQKTQRLNHVMKNREGGDGVFATRFTFQPVCFEEVPYTPQEEETTTQGGNDLSWMV